METKANLIPETIHHLFDIQSHNPSFHSVKDANVFAGQLLDFCVPVNLHFPPADLLARICRELPDILRYYPDYAEVHQRNIAAMTGVAPDMIVPANGSTEVITILCQEATGPIITSVPTFGRWTDLPVERKVPLHTIQRRRESAFRLEVDEVVRAARQAHAETLVVSNPNNPTGAWFTAAEIEALAWELKDLRNVVIDESFIDFADIESATSLAERSHNLIVVKSMGKAIGWHGVRLGYAVAEPGRAAGLRAKLPYWNINGLAAFVLRHAQDFRSELRESFTRVAEDREWMATALSAIPGLTVYPSKANFLFVELPDGVAGRELRDRLLSQHGVMVRETSNKVGSTEKYLRLAVHGRAAVEVLCRALRSELAEMTGLTSGRYC